MTFQHNVLYFIQQYKTNTKTTTWTYKGNWSFMATDEPTRLYIKGKKLVREGQPLHSQCLQCLNSQSHGSRGYNSGGAWRGGNGSTYSMVVSVSYEK